MRRSVRAPMVAAALVVVVATTFAVDAPSQAEEEEADEIWFEDVTARSGNFVAHKNRSFENPYAHIMEGYTALGASASTADIDGDGHLDLFVTDSSKDGRNLLYLGRGDFTFEEVGEKAGVAAGNDAANASANSLFFDRDGDGDPDLLLIRFGQNLLYDNRGDGTFRDITKASGLEKYLNCIAAIAFDYDLDGDLDLFYANYFAPVNLFDPETPRFFPESFETAANGGGVTVFRNDSQGSRARFVDVTDDVGLGQISGWSLDLGHADADHDGDDDLYIAADFGTDSLFRNNADGTFTDVSEEAIGIDTKKGMNADWGDFDGDGLFDLYVTNITDEYMREGNFLWQNQGGLLFADVARETGTHDTGWGWAGKFFDVDNDGWLDLYVVNGWVSGNEENYVLDIFNLIINEDADLADARNWPPMGEKTLSGYQRSSLFHNQGGALFDDIAERHGVDSLLDGRGVVVADFDHDGRQDLFVTNANAEPLLLANRAPARPFVKLSLEGRESNRQAIGARVRVKVGATERWSFVNGGNGFASQSSLVLHFGLGEAMAAKGSEGKAEHAAVETAEEGSIASHGIDEIEVFWPSGKKSLVRGLEAGRRYHWIEGAEPQPWRPGIGARRAVAPPEEKATP